MAIKTKKKDTLGNKIKDLEGIECFRKFIPNLPIIVRADGRSFHQFTKGLARPYDTRFSSLMVETTKYLVEQTVADLGYTQSDEISLILLNNKGEKSQPFFNGRIFKIISTISALCSVYFNKHLSTYIPEKANKTPTFDCRSFQAANNKDIIDYLLWRETDATKNSISMASQSVFSHKSLQNLNTSEMQEKLFQEKNINWNDYPDFFKKGTYIRRFKDFRSFSYKEIEKLPINHEARSNPNLLVERNTITELTIPPIAKLLNPYLTLFGPQAANFVPTAI